MSHQRALKKSGLAIGVLALLLAGSESLSYGGACLQPTPNPCSADGVCRPVSPWGYSRTRWRTWPGESTSLPTPAETKAPDEGGEQGLRPYELPQPAQEDLRGPAKSKKDEQSDDAAAEEMPGDGAGQLLPGPEALPAFDPQGKHLDIPGKDDSPPALPASLRQAARSAKVKTSQASAAITPQRTLRQLPPATPATVAPSIRQASWQPPNSIRLINPASAIVTDSDAGSLQQAIYYEASDQNDAPAK